MVLFIRHHVVGGEARGAFGRDPLDQPRTTKPFFLRLLLFFIPPPLLRIPPQAPSQTWARPGEIECDHELGPPSLRTGRTVPVHWIHRSKLLLRFRKEIGRPIIRSH